MLLLTSFVRSFAGVALTRVALEAFQALDPITTPPTSTTFEPGNRQFQNSSTEKLKQNSLLKFSFKIQRSEPPGSKIKSTNEFASFA